MKLLLAYVVWFALAAVFVKATIMAVNGQLWLMIVSLVVFVLLFVKYGCLTHD
jgi:hypothetical protein